MKIVSWNVNGLRACLEKGLADYLADSDAGIIAIQETKTNTPLAGFPVKGYSAAWGVGDRPGYSGTLCLFKETPISVLPGFGENNAFDARSRVITLKYRDFYFINVYAPNSYGDRSKWYYRLDWDTALAEYIDSLHSQNKALIICGDFNVAHKHIDIFPESTRNDKDPPGFSSEERGGFDRLLEFGLVDVFRWLHPDLEGAYTWWVPKKRKQNKGRRLDYFLVSESLIPRVQSCGIRPDVFGSDHAPVELIIDI